MSIDGGVDFFEPADNYTEGENEIILGPSLKNLKVARGDVVIATKVYCRGGPGQNDIRASRGQIKDAVEASLRRLQTDYIDLYQIHADELVFSLEETLCALDTLVTQGKVRYTGCSNWPAWTIAKALDISELGNLAQFVSIQGYYSIAGRPGMGNRSTSGIREGRPASGKPAYRRPAFREVHPLASEHREFAPR